MLKGLVSYLQGVADPRTLAYDAGKRDRSSSWDPQGLSPVGETLDTLPRLRAKSRDLIQNNDIAASAVVKLTNGVVGWGIHPQAASDSDDFNDLLDRQFDEWSRVCTPSGLDYYGLQCQSTYGMFTSGETFIVVVEPPRDAKVPIPLWLIPYEADLVDDQLNEDTQKGTTIRQGIEFDVWGRAVAYYFHRGHPGDPFFRGGTKDHIRIPAGQVLHYAEKPMWRSSQVRAVPRLAPVINTIRNLSDFQMAEIMKQKIAACFGVIFSGVEAPDDSRELCNGSGKPITKAWPGMIGYAPAGTTVTTLNPPSVEGYWDYIRGHQHGVAAGVGVPYARLTGDLTKVNFASSRIGEGYYIRENDAVQWLTAIPLLCDPVWRLFLAASYRVGRIVTPKVRVNWSTQQFPSANPAQDAQAKQMAVRDGQTTLSRVIAEAGENPRKIFQERARENAILDKLGLVFDSDPRQRTLAGVTQPVYDPSNGEPTDTGD